MADDRKDLDVDEIFNQFGDLFNDLFAAGVVPPGRGGRDVMLHITREVAAAGGIEMVRVDAGECDECEGTPCPHCEGRGSTQVQQGFFVIQNSCAHCSGGRQRPSTCAGCEGSGRRTREVEVEVPIGAESGQILTIAGAGPIGEDGEAEELVVHLMVKQVELPAARLHEQDSGRGWPVALAVGGAIAAAIAATLLF